jgi:hypothetical protein
MTPDNLTYRIGQIVCANTPTKDTYLYSRLAVEFVYLTKSLIHDTIQHMVDEGLLIKLNYKTQFGDGALFFPPKSTFEFVNRVTETEKK